MSWQTSGPQITLPASGDLHALQYCGVTINSSGQIAAPSAGLNIYGVLQNKPTATGMAAEVRILSSVVKMYCPSGAGVTAGDRVKPDAAGKLVTCGATDEGFGVALETAAASTICPVLLHPCYRP